MPINPKYHFQKNQDLIRAIWVVDSETSRQYLIDIDKNQIIAERKDGKIIDPGELK